MRCGRYVSCTHESRTNHEYFSAWRARDLLRTARELINSVFETCRATYPATLIVNTQRRTVIPRSDVWSRTRFKRRSIMHTGVWIGGFVSGGPIDCRTIVYRAPSTDTRPIVSPDPDDVTRPVCDFVPASKPHIPARTRARSKCFAVVTHPSDAVNVFKYCMRHDILRINVRPWLLYI